MLTSMGPTFAHTTSNSNSQFSVNFTGDALTVYGLVEEFTDESSAPMASYLINSTVVGTPVISPNNFKQPTFLSLFKTDGLPPNGTHNLTVIVNRVSDKVPYMFLGFSPGDDHFMLPAQLSGDKSGPSHRGPDRTTLVIGAVLGSIIFLLLCIIAGFFVLRWRRRRVGGSQAWRQNFMQRSIMTSSAGIPLTSTESILGPYYQRRLSSGYPTGVTERTSSMILDKRTNPTPVSATPGSRMPKPYWSPTATHVTSPRQASSLRPPDSMRDEEKAIAQPAF
ncbi:hypothetical protein BC834DRAFT_874747 [Gloeopeniophorella convolvens]|nr:hypothetical protein BC834DRAFT_874747 [Gloeopeniophorella convolvens]